MPAIQMPPASELFYEETAPEPSAAGDIRAAFAAWFEQRQQDDENPDGVRKRGPLMEEAFNAGALWMRQQFESTGSLRKVTQELQLEGTVESRTIIAALELFKAQVLVENPPEVKSGEWLNARDVDVLITGIRANAAKGR